MHKIINKQGAIQNEQTNMNNSGVSVLFKNEM